MMRQEFNAIMKPFFETFGESNYPQPKLQLVWAAVHDLSPDQFRRIVETLIGENKPEYPPKVSLFREFAEVERKKALDRAAQEAISNPRIPLDPEKFENKEAALRAVKVFWDALVETPAMPQWVRDDIHGIAARTYPHLTAEVQWLKDLVVNDKADDEIRREYVTKSKQLILNITTRAVFQPSLLNRYSVNPGEGA